MLRREGSVLVSIAAFCGCIALSGASGAQVPGSPGYPVGQGPAYGNSPGNMPFGMDPQVPGSYPQNGYPPNAYGYYGAPPNGPYVPPQDEALAGSLKPFQSINLRFRDIVVPGFIIDLATNGGETFNVFTFGPEVTWRKGRNEFNLALSYADYSFDPMLLKSPGENIEGYELASSTLKVIYFTVDILYEIPLDRKQQFAFLFGGGVGAGVVFGDVFHAQAYPKDTSSPNTSDPGSWERCPGATFEHLVQGTNTAYCDVRNDDYGNHSEPSWANGGSKWNIVPWLAFPQLSLRAMPTRDIQIRVDTGLSLSGPYWGLSSGYRF